MNMMRSSLLKWPQKSPAHNAKEHLWVLANLEIDNIDVQVANLKQLCDANTSIWTKIFKESF